MVIKNEMPKVNKTNIIDRIGSTIFESLFADELILIPHSGNKDFGIDYHADIINKNEKSLIGYYLGIQLKSHQTIKWNTKNEYKQRIKISTANYWLSLNVPVVMVLVDNVNHSIYGIDVKEQLRKNWDRYDLSKRTITISIQENDSFNTKCYVNCIHNFRKYQLLLDSITDYYLIRCFISYMSNIGNRDFFLLIDDYADLSNEILELCDKYSFAFLDNIGLMSIENKMKECLKDCYVNNKIDYENYIEQTREKFNNIAFDYFTELVNSICNEIEKDKTKVLYNRLHKFLNLKKEIKNHNSFNDPYWKEFLNYSEYIE